MSPLLSQISTLVGMLNVQIASGSSTSPHTNSRRGASLMLEDLMEESQTLEWSKIGDIGKHTYSVLHRYDSPKWSCCLYKHDCGRLSLNAR